MEVKYTGTIDLPDSMAEFLTAQGKLGRVVLAIVYVDSAGLVGAYTNPHLTPGADDALGGEIVKTAQLSAPA